MENQEKKTLEMATSESTTETTETKTTFELGYQMKMAGITIKDAWRLSEIKTPHNELNELMYKLTLGYNAATKESLKGTEWERICPMYNQFIPYAQSLELKELDFNQLCLANYFKISQNSQPIIKLGELTHDDVGRNSIPAPTFDQAFSWFRDKHNISGYSYQPNETGYWANSLENKATYDSFEESELKRLIQFIEIVKTKNN